MVTVRVLGSIEVTVDGESIVLANGRVRTAMAVLALDAGRVVSRDRLIDAVWGDQWPDSVSTQVSILIHKLRKLLGPDTIATVGQGYCLDPALVEVDVVEAQQLLDQARQGQRCDLFRDALRKWRGPVCEGLSSEALLPDVQRFESLFLAGVEEWAVLELDSGGERELVQVLPDLVTRHPLREGLRTRLVETLWRCGRRAEALGVYDEGRRVLADDLGLDPGEELTSMHQRILEEDTPPAPRSRATGRRVETPRQLPMHLPRFAGRDKEVEELEDLVGGGNDGSGTLVAVHGQGGVGKTTLVVHVAHRLIEQFPDGQIFVNLRGRGTERPVDTLAALTMILRAVGIAEAGIPGNTEEAAALMRSTLADRRMLVVLDNALDSVQVRPLLPGGTCAVMVTSRSQLRSLAAREDAQRVAVDALSSDEAVALLTARRSPGATPWSRADMGTLAELCGRLPVALAVAAERANRFPDRALAEFNAELREGRSALDALTSWEEDAAVGVRAVLAWSYDALGAEEARLFRLLGLHPHPEFDRAVAAALAGYSVTHTASLLDTLVDGHLLVEHRPGAFVTHDLVHAFAGHVADAATPLAERREALSQMRSWYLHSVHNARVAAGTPMGPRQVLPDHESHLEPMEFGSSHSSRQWFSDNQGRCLAVLDQASRDQDHDTVQRLSGVMASMYQTLGAFDSVSRLSRSSLAAAERACDGHGVALATRRLGIVQRHAGDLEGALRHYVAAEASFRQLGHEDHAAVSAWDQAVILIDLKRPADALDSLDRIGRAVLTIPWLHPQVLITGADAQIALHRFSEAQATAQRAVAESRRAADSYAEATALTALAECLSLTNDHDQAIERYERALEIFSQLDTHVSTAATHAELGRAQQRASRIADARDSWRHALAVLDAHDVEDDPNFVNRPELRDLLAQTSTVP